MDEYQDPWPSCHSKTKTQVPFSLLLFRAQVSTWLNCLSSLYFCYTSDFRSLVQRCTPCLYFRNPSTCVWPTLTLYLPRSRRHTSFNSTTLRLDFFLNSVVLEVCNNFCFFCAGNSSLTLLKNVTRFCLHKLYLSQNVIFVKRKAKIIFIIIELCNIHNGKIYNDNKNMQDNTT